MYPGSGQPGSVPRRVNPNGAGAVGGGVPNVPSSVGSVNPIRDMREMRDLRGNGVSIPPMQMAAPGGANVGVVSVAQGQPNIVGGNASRIVDMLESAKNEFESVLQQLNISKIENMELERKIQSQVAEMDQIQQTLKALENNHRRLRQQYEEDVIRMRRQMEGGVKMGMPPAKRSRGDEQAPPPQAMPPMNPGQPMVPGRSQRSGSPVRVAPAPSMGRPAGLDERDQRGRERPSHQGPPPMQSSSLAPLESNNLHTPTAGRRGPMPGMPSSRDSDRRDVVMDRRDPQERDAVMKGDDRRHGPPQASAAVGGSSANSSPVMKKVKSSSGPDAKSGSKVPAAAPLQTSPGNQKMHHLNNQDTNESTGSVTPPPSTAVPGNSTPSNGGNAGFSGTSSSAGGSSKQSKVKWSITYSNKGSSTHFPETERPTVEMHHTLDHQSVVCCVRFSADGTKMASGCHKTAQVFDVATGARTFWVQRPAITAANGAQTNENEDAYVRSVCFSPDGTKLVAGMPQNTIRIWDIASNEEGPPLVGHEAEIYSLDYVNNLIVSGSGDRKVRLWDARSGECRHVFGTETGGPADGVTNVALSPDGRLLAAASLDKVVRIWNTETSQLMDRLEGHCDSVYSLAFSPDGKNVISGSLDKNIMLWDVSASGRTTTRPRMLFQGHKDFVLSVAYTPDGRWIMSGSKDRSVIFWDPRTARSVLTLSGYRNSVISVASSPASPFFATGSGDCFACIWKYQCQTI
ncbi:transcriptional repressor TUP1-like protein [Achlya hypogyna]|uniref:Transcriptional repressor TUP1-like protein n=1 Tax=Achlya hypogyna TaxID=1202772 RepID=A0A1V9Z610_ACHHY|nr:transcriptional repressor TUP1-like protein [Achlya hypogyna]